MLLYILAGAGFWSLAKRKELSPILWAIIAVVATVLGQVIGGFIVGFTNPQIINNTGAIWAVAIFASLVALAIVWFALNAAAKKKNETKVNESTDVLDDEFLETL